MPSIIAIILTTFYGSNGIKLLLKKLIIWRANPLFYVFVLFYSLAYYIMPVWICNITGNPYKLSLSVNFYNILINFLLFMLLGGPLGEELGWRGFLLPKLQSKLNSVNFTGTLLSYNSLAYLAKSFNKYTAITVILQLVFVLFPILDMIKKPINFSKVKSQST